MRPVFAIGLLLAILASGLLGACGESAGVSPQGPVDASLDAMDARIADASSDGWSDVASDGGRVTDAMQDSADGTREAAAPGTLTLSLDPSLDTPADVVKATAIVSGQLLDGTGATVAVATVTNGIARFSLAATIAGGDYFI